MELEEFPIIADRKLIGANSFTISSGKIKIEVGGDKVLDEPVPDGKSWEISIHVKIVETTI